MSTPHLATPAIVYPDSDGQPMAENTLQFRWIVTIKEGLDALFRDRPDVFVAGDLFWYPIEGDPQTRVAPDTLVVFGRPKGDRGSYRQWCEDGVAPQVVFEILSPGNRASEMQLKLLFYQRHGVEEYYLYDPDLNQLDGWRREEGELRSIVPMHGWISPRLGIRFEWTEAGLRLIRPDGRALETYEEVDRRAEAERQRAEAERRRAEGERRRANAEHERADAERQRANRLAEKLRALGVDPEETNGAKS
jgi:Uma2 family endonuclease